MSDLDDLEEDGHDLTVVHGPSAGVTTYFCENCGALIQLEGFKLVLFHMAKGPDSTGVPCARRVDVPALETLKEKLADLFDKDYEKLRAM